MSKGVLKRIKPEVIELVKQTGCWDHGKNIGCAIENMAKFCITEKKKVEKWMKES